MQIPYTVEERSDTGFNNATLGIWLFLTSEIMLFGGLFSSYILLRVGAAQWPLGADLLNVPLATLNTFLLVFSSIAIVFAWAAIKQNEFGSYRKWMGISLLCGLVFLVIKAFEYQMKFSHGMYPSSSTFLAIYFTMTGLHALHIIGGLLVNSYLWGPGAKMFKTDPQRFSHRVEIAGIYWHFVDLLWIVLLFPVLYLL
jgi:heme/copper-type cytochrome/quinol oxidase subunit 3